MGYTYINIFGALVEYFAIYAFLWIFFEPDSAKKKWIYFWHIAMPVLFFLLAKYVNNIYLRPSLFVICTWVVAYGFKGDLAQRIFSVSIFQIILILLEIGFAFSLEPNLELSTESRYLVANILNKSVTLAIVAVLFFISRKRKNVLGRLPWNYVLLLLLFSAVSLALVTFAEYLLLQLDRAVLFPYGCLIIVLCVCTNVALYYIFYQLAMGEEAKNRLQLMELHLSQQKEQQQYMEHAYRETRRLSHDMNNYLVAILGLLQDGRTEAAVQELQKRNIEVSTNPLFDTGDSMLNSILAYKFQLAKEQQIQMQLFWNLSEPLRVSSVDLAVILSNGLDNALEAAVKVTDAQPFVIVKGGMSHGFIKLTIRNNTATDPIVEYGKLITSKEDKSTHGWGFESMQTLARRYDGDAYFDYKDYIFELNVILDNKQV